jgi:hypothetical protein
VDVLDLGDIAKDHWLGSQEGGRYAGQGRVLIAARAYAALDREAALDEVLVHMVLYGDLRENVNAPRHEARPRLNHIVGYRDILGQDVAAEGLSVPYIVVISALGDRLKEEQNNLFLSAWYGPWDRKTRDLRYASAGSVLGLEPFIRELALIAEDVSLPEFRFG